MSEIDTAELRRLLEAATPGPWEAWESLHAETFVSQQGRRQFGVVTNPATGSDDYGRADAYLIAAAVNALPALLDAADERDAAIRQARADALREAGDAYDPAGEHQARGWVVGWLVDRAELEEDTP